MDPERCDPVLLSCITMEEIQFVFPLIFVVFGAVLIWTLVRSELRKLNGHQPKRGTAAGEGETVHSVYIPPQSSTSAGHTIHLRHTKDPQKHAQAMMPANARKKDQTK